MKEHLDTIRNANDCLKATGKELYAAQDKHASLLQLHNRVVAQSEERLRKLGELERRHDALYRDAERIRHKLAMIEMVLKPPPMKRTEFSDDAVRVSLKDPKDPLLALIK